MFRTLDVVMIVVMTAAATVTYSIKHQAENKLEEVRKLGSAEDLKTIWASNGAEYGGMTQPQFAAMVSSEVKRWAAVVKASGAKLD